MDEIEYNHLKLAAVVIIDDTWMKRIQQAFKNNKEQEFKEMQEKHPKDLEKSMEGDW